MQKNIITTILKKGHITGDDVGRLYVANACHELKTLVSEHRQIAGLTQAEFENVANKLTENEDIRRLNYYISVMNGVKACFNMTNAHLKNICYYLESFKGIITQLTNLTLGVIEASKQPVIMTQKQYDLALEEATREYCERPLTYYEVLIDACSYYIIHYSNLWHEYEEAPDKHAKPKTDKEVDKLLNKYNSEPIKNKELLELVHNEYAPNDYDTVNLDCFWVHDYNELIKELDYRNIKIDKALIKGLDLTQAVTREFIEKALTPEQIEKHITFEHHTATKKEDLTKYDLINCIGNLTTYCTDIDTVSPEEKAQLLHIMDLFLKELPELDDLITDRLSKIPLLKKCTNAGVKNYLDIKFKTEDFIKAKVLDYDYKNKWWLHENYCRYGVAIIQEDTINDLYIGCGSINNEGGYKKEDGLATSMFKAFKERLEDLAYNIPENVNVYKKAGLELDVLFVKASIKYVDLFNEVARIPDLDIYKHSLYEIEKAVNDYNHSIDTLLNYVLIEYRYINYDDANKLRKVIHNAIPYFKTVEEIEIKEANIKKAREAVKDIARTQGNPNYTKPMFILVGEGE